jgi:beta-galactosidase
MNHERIWEDPAIVERHRQPMHAPMAAWPDEAGARKAEREASPNRLLLNGQWRFRFFPSPEAVPDDFYRPDFLDAAWSGIQVPGNWQLDPACPEWDEKRVYLNFESVDSAFLLWINGVEIGYSQDSRLPAEFEITDRLRPGVNLIAVLVLRYSCGSYLEDQDYWQMSGIQKGCARFRLSTKTQGPDPRGYAGRYPRDEEA